MKKKTIRTVAFIVVLVMAFSTYAFARGTGRILEVTGDGVHLRAGPGTDYASYGLLWKGERLVEDSCRIPGHGPTTGWAHPYSSRHSTCGYVSTSYLKIVTSIP